MVGFNPKNKNAKTASILDQKSLFLKRLVIAVGRPFFLLLYLILATLIYLPSLIAKLVNRLWFDSKKSFKKKDASLLKKEVINYQDSELINKLIGSCQWLFARFLPSVCLKIRLYLYLTKTRLRKIIRLKKLRFPRKRIIFLFFSGILLLFSLITYLEVFKDLPSPNKLGERNLEISTKIYDRNKVLLYKIYKNKNRTVIPLEQIPSSVRLATLAAEDAEFYTHPGFSIRGIFRSIIRNITKGELTGGSTITQQLVKNTLLTPEKSLIRKIKEIILAVQVELIYPKDKILEMYLNEVPYGGTAYGIEEASKLYFDKSVGELSLAQAALLAGLTKSPTRYSPFGEQPKLALKRKSEVLNLMFVNKYISLEEKEKADQENLQFVPHITDIKAPHFVMFVRQFLVEKYGEEMVEKGGLEVITSLDYQIQTLAEKIVQSEVKSLSKLNVKNGAVLVLNPQNGEILAMVGSKDYFDQQNDGNVNLTTALRQPGSSIKIINYAYALSNGYTPASIISDSPITFAVAGQPPYSPKNYDGKFRGNLTLRSAFAESRNIPAVKILASYGVSNMLEMGKKMGITSWNETNRFGLSLTLGGGEVKLLDLARVYATIANYGERPNLIPILKITNAKGKIIEEHLCLNPTTTQVEKTDISLGDISAKENLKCQTEKVVDPRVAYLITDILKDNGARSPAFGSNSYLVIPNHKEVAVKTGTSNDLRDNLTIGYNQNYLVAVWVGNNDNSPMSRIASGVTGASPIFNKIMVSLLNNSTNHEWDVPAGLIQIPICAITGTLPCEGCPYVKSEWFLNETVPKTYCKFESIKPETNSPGGQILDEAAKTEVILFQSDKPEKLKKINEYRLPFQELPSSR